MGEQVSRGVHGREFTVFGCKLLVSEGKRRGEDRLTAEFTECAEGTGERIESGDPSTPRGFS